MKLSKVLLSAMMVFALCTAQAQNPWKKYGYTPPKALTLSNGKYEEFFNNDTVTVTQIGSVMFNTATNEVVAFVDTKHEDKETSLRAETISRFLSIDPLEKEFPMLSPCQFASNRPIDGLDRDGLEYATYTIFVQYGKVKDITVTKDYELKDKNTLGPGVQYNYAYLDKNGKIEKFEAKSLITNYYGMYQGPKNPQLPQKGGDPNKLKDDYGLSPIDETDANAKQHDQDYDKNNLKGLSGVMDARSTPANEDYIKRAEKTIEKQKSGGKDDITGKPVSTGAADAAKTGKAGFRIAEKLKDLPKIEWPKE